jgi:hypothetical protein
LKSTLPFYPSILKEKWYNSVAQNLHKVKDVQAEQCASCVYHEPVDTSQVLIHVYDPVESTVVYISV